MAGLLYNLLLLLISPLGLLVALWRVFVSRKSSESWRENLGGLPMLSNRPSDQKLVWIHAASVGEIVASVPVQDQLRKLLPDALILVTTVTQTGNAMAKKCAKSADAIAYLPWDLLPFVNRAINRVRPDLFVMVEAEIWPNLLAGMHRRCVPTVVINGRVSDRSFRRSQKARWLMSWAISGIDYCCMQTSIDAQRILSIGADADSVKVLGSTKFDQGDVCLDADQVSSLRMNLGIPEEARVFVAGSTNEGEDLPVISAYVRMRETVNNLRLIIAPRQTERGPEIQSMAESMGLKCVRRSDMDHRSSDYDVLVLDTFGELATAYAVGEITFVGGTLIRKGGHSIIQPILQGKPVLFGPYTFKTRDVAQMAIAAGIGVEVKDGDDLAVRGGELLGDSERRRQIETACAHLVTENKGASGRCAELIAGLVTGGKGKFGAAS